ncbi:unnamed protein product [Closterium sp. Naga37s-1]|nr:unnamed protein product [Closterium sp. Naga37s-1]
MASAGGSVARAHHARSSSATVAVIPAERFAVLSFPPSLGNSAVSSPVAAPAGDPAARLAESAASPSAPPPARPAQAQAAGATVPVPDAAGGECAAQPGITTEPLATAPLPVPRSNSSKDGNCASASQSDGFHGGGAASEPPARAAASNPSSSYGLSLQQLQHLVALTNANDSPRDSAAAFPYAATSDGRPGRSRLSINSAQRRLDSWNRAREPVVENSIEYIRAQRKLKRSGSDPSLRQSALGGEDSMGGPSRPLEGVVSEARKVAMRRWLRRSRSAHTLGEKDTAARWNEAMTAIIWGRGGAVVYRRPAGGSSQARPSGGERGTAGGESGTPKRAAAWGTARRGRRATGRAAIRGAAGGDSSTPGRAAGSGTAGGDSNTLGRAAARGRAGGDSSIPGRAADRGTAGGTSSTPGRAAGRGAAEGDSNTPGRAAGRGAAGSARITPVRASSRGAGGDDISTTGLTMARSSVGCDSSTPGRSSVGGTAGGGHCIPWRAADAGVAGRGHITSGCAAARGAAGDHCSTLRRAKGAGGGELATPRGRRQTRGRSGATTALRDVQHPGGQLGGMVAPQGAQQRGGLPGVIVGDYDMQQLGGKPGVAAADQVVQWQGGGCEQGTESPRQSVTFDTPMAAVEVAVASDEGHHELPPPLPRYPCNVCFHTFATRGAAASHMTACRLAEAERRAYALGLIPSLAEDGTQERPTVREIQDGVWAAVPSWDWEAFFCVEAVGGKTVRRIPQRARLGVLDALPADQTRDGSEGIDHGAFDGVLGGEMA